LTETATQEYLIRIEEELKELKKKQFLNSKIIKWSLIFLDLGYVSIFLTGILLAMFVGPNSYNPYYNAISDLGWSEITPYPFLFDTKVFLGGIMLIITVIVVKKRFDKTLGFEIRSLREGVFRKRLINYGLIFGIVGAVGYLFAGVYNVDRSGPNGIYHYLAAVATFGGFIISISIFSYYILIYKVNIPKPFAIFGLTLPFISVLLWFITHILLFEWISFLSIMGFLIPFQSKKVIQKLSFITNLR
jgi:hypothetical protein